MIDTHTHLTDPWFNDDRDEVIAKAFDSGIQKIVEIATSPDEWQPTLDLCKKYPGKIFCSIGFHPHCAHEWKDNYEKVFCIIFNNNILGKDFLSDLTPGNIAED